jgi:predicted nucleic acid-binding protein
MPSFRVKNATCSVWPSCKNSKPSFANIRVWVPCKILFDRAGSRAAIAALEKIEASPLVRIEFANAKNHQSATNWLKKLSEHSISYTDAISFSIMEAAGCREVLSYNHHFRAAGFEIFSRPSR